jgi:hypothetical protein
MSREQQFLIAASERFQQRDRPEEKTYIGAGMRTKMTSRAGGVVTEPVALLRVVKELNILPSTSLPYNPPKPKSRIGPLTACSPANGPFVLGPSWRVRRMASRATLALP